MVAPASGWRANGPWSVAPASGSAGADASDDGGDDDGEG